MALWNEKRSGFLRDGPGKVFMKNFKIAFTRSRPYKKNDNCFLKQEWEKERTGSKVRKKHAKAKTPYETLSVLFCTL